MGKKGIIISITARGQIRRRLFDLGLVPGTRIENVRRSPTGGLNAYLIRDTLIALRKGESDQIFIIPDA